MDFFSWIRSFLKSFRKPGQLVEGHLRTIDSETISFCHYKTGHKRVIILAHGFFNNKDAFLFREMIRRFSVFFDVIAFDFRGHGKSSGLFTWTTRESNDLEAVIGYVAVQGYSKVGLIGFSLGAAVSLIVASRCRDIHSVIAVSAPYDFWKIDCHFWKREMLEDLKLNFGYKGIGKRVKPGNPFLEKVPPIGIVDKITPTPVFFIHGDQDWLIKPYHSQRLFEQAREPKKLFIVKNTGHAEKIFDAEPDLFIGACRDWFEKTLI